MAFCRGPRFGQPARSAAPRALAFCRGPRFGVSLFSPPRDPGRATPKVFLPRSPLSRFLVFAPSRLPSRHALWRFAAIHAFIDPDIVHYIWPSPDPARHSALFLAAARPRSLKPPRHKARVPTLCEINDLPRQPTAPRNAAPKAKVRRGSQPPRFNDRRLPTAPTPRDPPRRRSKPPRSTTDPPRSPSKVPRSGLKVPRSIPVLPRRVLDLPRSGFALPRFAAELGFAFPCATGLFIPLAAKCRDARFRARHFMGVFTPVAAAPAHPRFAWARTVYPRCHATPSPPKPPVLPRSLGLRFCRGACFRKVPRHAPTTTDRAAPRPVVVRGRVPQASPSRGTILAVRRE